MVLNSMCLLLVLPKSFPLLYISIQVFNWRTSSLGDYDPSTKIPRGRGKPFPKWEMSYSLVFVLQREVRAKMQTHFDKKFTRDNIKACVLCIRLKFIILSRIVRRIVNLGEYLGILCTQFSYDFN